jgi:hypothetical protein
VLANAFYALLGAIFGVLLASLPALYKSSRHALNQAKTQRRRKIMMDGSVDRWLIEYYDRRGVDLCYSEIGGFGRYIPVSTHTDWIFEREIEPNSEWLVRIGPEPVAPFPIDERLLEARRRMGAVLFQSWRKSAYLDSVSNTPSVGILARPCEYFEIATALIALEEETFVNVLRSGRRFPPRRQQTPLRDRHLRGFPAPTTRLNWPFSVGCHTVLLVEEGDNKEILVQTRGETVITYPGAMAAIPNFGFEPNRYGQNPSKYGCVFYNFVREYLEELFDYEEIIGRTTWSHDPDWLFDLPEARALMRAHANSGFALSYLGSGIECLSGTMTIALVAVLRDSTAIQQLRRRLTPNYEVALPTTSRTPVEFVRIADPRLALWHESGKFQPSSAFAIGLALKRLAATPGRSAIAHGDPSSVGT